VRGHPRAQAPVYSGRMLQNRRLLVALTLVCGCADPVDPLEAALPPLPPEGGPAVASAGRLTADNFAKESVAGPASNGLVGDYFMRNDKIRLVVQAPGRAIGPCPFGGNVIDADRVESPAGDQLGEVSPFMQLGRTIAYDKIEVVRDGAAGGPAVIRAYGHDAKNDFINLPGLGSFAVGIADDYRADVDLKWRMAVTYILMPGETRVRMIYTFHNPGTIPAATLWGTLTDTGAGPEIFHSFLGFGELGFSDITGSNGIKLIKYVGFQAKDITYGVLPLLEDKNAAGAAVPVAGVDVEVYQIGAIGDAFGPDGQSIKLAANGTGQREVDLLVGRDVADVTAQVHAARGEDTVDFSGTVDDGAGARVTVLDAQQQVVTVATCDASGHFKGSVPAGAYRLQAEGEAFLRSQAIDVTMPTTGIKLTLPKPAQIRYTVKDRGGASIAAKISIIGATPATPDRRFRDIGKDRIPHGMAAWIHSLHGDSARGDRYDHPIDVAPGRYRFVATRGPEWSRFEQIIDVTSQGVDVAAVLDHTTPTPGYIAADFHQHSHISPDAVTPPEDRAVSYVVDGADFISSSEHDVLFDYRPIIDKLGLQDLLDSSIGIETTAWDYGHFIAFPFTVDPLSPNGGAFDWAGGEMGLSLPPPKIFEGLRQQGAKVVQVNHPRGSPGDFSTFQQAFDRAGLRFDFAARTFFGDTKLMPINALVLGVEPDSPMFAPTFDTLEIYNGHHLAKMPVMGERLDGRVDINLKDWMNFLSFGFTPAPTGVSDTHQWISSPAALPRTLVRVPDDSSAGLLAGVEASVIDTLLGKVAPKDVIVTNGPFMKFTVDGKGIGSTVSHAAGPLAIHVEVHAPVWSPIETIELFANNTFDIPAPKGTEETPLQPIICFTSRTPATDRCKNAIGGARALPAATAVETVAGVASSVRLEYKIDINDVDPDAIAGRNRAGAMGKDIWLVARCLGDTGLFPMIPDQISGSPMDLVDDLAAHLPNNGIPALAFTNAIFVDVDGTGWRGIFQP
jgi:hypothetical protein